MGIGAGAMVGVGATVGVTVGTGVTVGVGTAVGVGTSVSVGVGVAAASDTDAGIRVATVSLGRSVGAITSRDRAEVAGDPGPSAGPAVDGVVSTPCAGARVGSSMG